MNSELRPIAIDYLFDGMTIGEDIYNYDRKVLLLTKGEVLTDHRISQLRNFNDNKRNISVFDMTYQILLEHGVNAPEALSQEYLEKTVGYTDIKDKTDSMLTTIEKTGRVSKDVTDSVAGDIAKRMRTVDPSLIFQCINAPNPIDEYLRRHCVNVGMLNGLIGRWLNMTDRQTDLLILAGLVHDVGKTKIPHEILDAPRRLTISEFEVMKMHPIYSHELLSMDNRFIEPVRLAARHHHEKMNGSGYPDGIGGDQISLIAKITAVSDIYDAMVSRRAYKSANNPFIIISQLSNKQFSELDMRIVKTFTEHMPSELVGKPVLLSDGSIGSIKHILANDLEHPLVEVSGMVKKTDKDLYCVSIVFDETDGEKETQVPPV